jgi:hypothetical protein
VLPQVPIPLKTGDPDVVLDLSAVFTTVYERARYDLTLDYNDSLTLPLPAGDAVWASD